MNLMGKIFTLLIFFMSICFLVISVMVGASHRNWKQMAEKMKDQATLATNRLNEAKKNTTEKEKLLASERVSRAMQLAHLESQLRVAREQYIAKEAQLRSVTEISQGALAELEQAQARLKQQDAEVADLKNNNTKLVDDIAMQFSIVQNKTNQIYELQNQITQLTEKEADMVAKLAKTKRVLDRNNLTEDDLTDHIVPKLDGLVVKVENGGLFAISLGYDDGVRVGHVMDIYRKDRYVGKGTIVKTESDLSAVRINREFMVDTVREGDHVTSKF